MSILMAMASAVQGFTVTLSGETGIDSSGLAPQSVGVRVGSDGKLYKLINGTPTQIDTGTDWIIPNNRATSDFDVFCSVSGDALDTGGGSEAGSVWLALSTNRDFYVTGDPSSASLDITLLIRYNGGSSLDSGQFTGTATVA